MSKRSTLADIYHLTASSYQNILMYNSETKQDFEMNETSFGSPISEPLVLV